MKKNNIVLFKEEKNIFTDSSSLIKKIESETLPERGYMYEICKNWCNIIKSDYINEDQQKLILENARPTCLRKYRVSNSYNMYVKCKHSEVKSIILRNENRIVSNINLMFNSVVVKNIKIE